MLLEVNDQKKLAYYWLTQEDLKNKALLSSLAPEQHDFNKRGYLVVEFHSGSGDIVQLTKELLLHNKEVLAEKNAKNDTNK